MKRFIPLFLLSLASGWAGAQAPAPTQPARLELALTASNSNVNVQAVPEDSSVVILLGKEAPNSFHTVYSFEKYDHRLQLVRSASLDVPKGYEFSRLAVESTDVYALFQSEVSEKKLWVAAFDSRTGETAGFFFDTKLSKDVYDMKVLGGNLFVTVGVDQHLTVLLLDLHTGRHQFLPAVYEPLPTNFTFLADSATKRAEFIMTQSNGFKTRLQLKQLSPDGSLLHSEFVQAESERGLITAQVSPGDSAARILAGTYTLRDPRYSQGLFAADLSAGKTSTGARHSLRFYDFLNFKHFFDFMSPGRAERLRQRGQRLRAADRQMRLRYRLLIHDLVPFQNGYVLVGEAYYPRYRYDYYGYGGFGYGHGYGSGYRPLSNFRNFDGYRSTHAIVCGFDRKGNLLWDNTFVLKDVENQDLVETVRLRPLSDGQRLALVYVREDEVHYKIIDRITPSPNDLKVPLRTSLNDDAKEKPASTSQGSAQAWYGSRFLAYGYQHVRVDNGPDREVFFINAVAFD